MKMIIENANIRGVEQKTGKNGNNYLIVRYEDETGKPEQIIDRDLSRASVYVRDRVLDLKVEYTSGRTKQGASYANIQITGVKTHVV